MGTVNLEAMDVDSLLELRAEVDAALEERSRDLRQQLARLQGRKGLSGRGEGRGGSALRGVKVPPKYQGPNGETWAGRGARPKWLTELLDAGHEIEEFAIGGAAEAADDAESEAVQARKPRRKRA
ncbi:regulator protein, putative [Rhodovulum sp. PH10]|uniref:H-NS histone family protein n=1 Tax=Rhodovulum sp. PH10 TaxID=1187851 RepID=UPI00027C230C|nr:H-NS family nucleoid-associated regulatory protein [Rhodovulum sp. PH10]EJW13208.1 regulator protein, putative [Rhodovulum sp. PH10]